MNRNFINSLIVLITKEVFRQCKVSEPSSVLPFYWHPNFHPAADTSWESRQAEWAKFSQENLNHPHAAPERYTKAISIMQLGFNIFGVVTTVFGDSVVCGGEVSPVFAHSACFEIQVVSAAR
ncbi:MAG: hypothetical protein GY861_16045 [bacterium]|nr:hypothetical protein [bacterium]